MESERGILLKVTPGRAVVRTARRDEEWSAGCVVTHLAFPGLEGTFRVPVVGAGVASAASDQGEAPKPSPDRGDATQRTPAPAITPAPKLPKLPSGEGKVFGYSATAILRWMGREGWDVASAFAVLQLFGAAVNEGTVRCQIKGWATRGLVPELTAEQEKEIRIKLKKSKKI
jgi:hypothetical protein